MSKNNKLSGQPVICQLFSFIPDETICNAVEKHNSDYYYKTLTTKKQLIFLLYGLITHSNSLRSLCKNLLFLEGKLMYIGVDKLPAVSTLSDANINRSSDVFAEIYFELYKHYKQYLIKDYMRFFLHGEIDPSKVTLFDATTISLFVDVFKGAGRNPIDGKKKGGIKVQTAMSLMEYIPNIIRLNAASINDKNFLGQLNPEEGTIYVFDKGYVSYKKYQQWTESNVGYVTRINSNASYEIIKSKVSDPQEYSSGGVIKDEIIHLRVSHTKIHEARLVTYKDPVSGKVLKFLSNLFEYSALSIALLYKCRWNMEVFFKQVKQNFELSYFYSDSEEGIKTQIWVALIANLIFTVIHKQVKEAELFTTIVNMAATNMGSYICYVSLLKTKSLKEEDRCNGIIQLEIFEIIKGGVSGSKKKAA